MASFSRLLRALFGNARAPQHKSKTSRSGKRKSSLTAQFRPAVEGLEERLVPTILFQPHYGNEARLLVNDYGQTFDGPKLSNTPVHLIFEGTYWQNPTGITAPDVVKQVLNITNSSYLSGAQQYGSDGKAFLAADWQFDTSMVAFPHYLDSGLSFYTPDLQTTATQYINPAEVRSAPAGRGVYFVVTPPNSWCLDAPEDGGYHTDAVIAPFGRWESVPIGWLGMAGTTKAQQIDAFSVVFSHELVEAVTDPYVPGNANGIEPGVWVTDPAGLPGLKGFGNFGEIGDFEPLQYDYRLANGSLVQSYWSVKDGAPIVPDGTSQVFTLAPDYHKGTFQGDYNLIVNGDQLANKNDTITVDSIKSATGEERVRVTLNGEVVTFDPRAISTISINTGTGADAVNVERLSSSVRLYITLGNGADAVNLSPVAQQLDNILGNVSIYGGGNTTVTANDSATLTQDVTYDFTPPDLSSLYPILHRKHGIGGLAGTGHDSLVYFSNINQFTVVGARSNNTFNVAAKGFVTPLILYGSAGTDSLNFNDQTNYNNDGTTYTVAPYSVTRVGKDVQFISGGARFTTDTASVKFSNVEYVTVNGGKSGNVFNVLGINNTETVVLNTGAGANTINVGDAANSLDGLGGSLETIGGGSDTLVLNDQAVQNSDWITNSVAFTVTQNWVSRSNTTGIRLVDNQGNNHWSTTVQSNYIYYFGVANLILEGDSLGNTYNVEGTPAHTNLTIDVGSSTPSSVVLGDPQGDGTALLANILGAVRISAADASPSVLVDDSADTTDHTIIANETATGVALAGLAPRVLYFDNVPAANIQVKLGTGTTTGLDAFFALFLPATTISVQSDNAIASYGDAVTLTAIVVSVDPGLGTPANTVTFFDNGVALGTADLDANGQASLSTNSLSAGDHAITASYDGDGSFRVSSSDSSIQSITAAATTIGLQADSTAANAGNAVTLTATVAAVNPGLGTPSGIVTFFDNGVAIGTADLDTNGQASLSTNSLGVGDHVITASYDGEGNFQGSTATAVTVTVTTLDQPGNLQHQFAFHFTGNYYQNYLGLNEKWFQDSQAQWYVITSDGVLSRWHGGTSLTRVATVDASLWTNPELLFQTPANLSPSAQMQLSQLEQAHGYHFAGSYWQNYLGRNEKWFQDNKGAWVILTTDGQVRQPQGTAIATVDPAVWDNPDLLFTATLPASAAAQLGQLQDSYGFHFSGDYYQSYKGLGAKWFQDRGNNWYALFSDGSLKSWQTINGQDQYVTVANLDSRVYTDPQLLFQTQATLSATELGQLDQVEKAHGFHFAGNYWQNYLGLNEKWLQDSAGAWFVLTADGQVRQWQGGHLGAAVANVPAAAWDHPDLLFGA